MASSAPAALSGDADAKLNVEGAVLFEGSGAKPMADNTSGAFFMWYPDRNALRVGTVASSEWNDAFIGSGSTVTGGSLNTALGANATISGGSANAATADKSSIGGGAQNSTTGIAATVAGEQVAFDIDDAGHRIGLGGLDAMADHLSAVLVTAQPLRCDEFHR